LRLPAQTLAMGHKPGFRYFLRQNALVTSDTKLMAVSWKKGTVPIYRR
jgi:hypothetical protein